MFYINVCSSGCSGWIIQMDYGYLWPILYCDVPFTWDQANHTCFLHNSTLHVLDPEEEYMLQQLEPKFGTHQSRTRVAHSLCIHFLPPEFRSMWEGNDFIPVPHSGLWPMVLSVCVCVCRGGGYS